MMFPQDVVANAPRIISDLRTIFPPQEGTFLIGPMAKLGWGTPDADQPLARRHHRDPRQHRDPRRAARSRCPTEDDAGASSLQVNFAGALEFDKQARSTSSPRCSTRASCSSPSTARWRCWSAFGDDAELRAQRRRLPPRVQAAAAALPDARSGSRSSILDTDDARIRVEGYFAVTTNTVQFGARRGAVLRLQRVQRPGPLRASTRCSSSRPFHFVVEISASVSLKVFGVGVFSVGLDLRSTGPTPWHVHGHRLDRLLFFSISVDDRRDVRGERRPHLAADRACCRCCAASSASPRAGRRSCRRRARPARDAAPARPGRAGRRAAPARLAARQPAARAARPRDRDASASSARRTRTGSRSTWPAAGSRKTRTRPEQFAAAQFHDLSDADKLSRPRRSSRCPAGSSSRAGAAVRVGARGRARASATRR